MEEAILVLHIIAVIAMIVIVLIQKSEGGALGMGGGGGGMGGLFSSRGAANILTRATAVLAVVFFSTSLTLAIFAKHGETPASILDTPIAEDGAQPGVPGQAGSEGGNGILDALRQQSPAPATGPQVPSSQ